MKYRRGFLLAEETLKIVIAVICLLFLAYLLVSIYLNNKTDEELELAKSSLEHLVEEINAGNGEVEIYNPKGWVISSWPRDTVKSRIIFDQEIKGDIPLSCSNLGWDSCICICDDAFNFEGNDCDKKGICLKNSAEVQEGGIKIEPPLILKIGGGRITK